MATGPQFTEALAPVCGIHPATLDRYMRALRVDGLIPASGKGGGRVASHLDHRHAASILLALAAASPAGAAAAVHAVGRLNRERRQPGNVNLWAGLAAYIVNRAAVISRDGVPRAPAGTNNWELTICLEPVMAWMSWTDDGAEQRDYYRDPQSELPRPADPQDVHRGVRRLTIITMPVLDVVAELCADTLRVQAQTPPNRLIPKKRPSRLGPAPIPEAPASAGSETETAATLPGDAAALATTSPTTTPPPPAGVKSSLMFR
jgi:hypothetical protein